MLLGFNLTDAETASSLLRDVNGNVRAAILCWAMVLSAFVILRIPRAVVLGCLVAAGVTVGLAISLAEIVPDGAVATPRASGMLATRGVVAPTRSPGAEIRRAAPAN